MLNRLFALFSGRLIYLQVVEAVTIGLFFIQGLRFLIGTTYARIASASLYPALDLSQIDPTLPGLIQPDTVNNELIVLALLLLLPLVAVILGRLQPLLFVAAAIAAGGRYVMVGSEEIIPAAVTVGGGLFYVTLLARHRMRVLPLMFVLAFAIDQLYRAFGDTLDPSWSLAYENVQLILSIGVVITALLTFLVQMRVSNDDAAYDRGTITFWGGIGLGAMLFLQMALLSMPNVIIGRAGLSYADYIWVTPALVVATLIPLMPWVRGQAREFISLFDSGVRGWSWMLLVMLLLVLGVRVSGVIGGISLIMAQFSVTMLWWWIIRPLAEKERSFAGLWIIIGMVIFGLLVVMDIFTYEYAYVRDFTGDYLFLNDIIPPLLRGFRDLGIAVLLLSAFMLVLPMARSQRRIAWRGGSAIGSLLTLVLAGGFAAGAYIAVRPPVVEPIGALNEVRIGTYNIHAGYNEFFNYDLDAIGETINASGASIVLLQEVEIGRLTSFGVDQVYWLARNSDTRRPMDARFYPTIEGVHGLAVLSDVEIGFDDGVLLDSIASQTGLQRVQVVLPDSSVVTLYNTRLDPLLDTGLNQATVDVEASQQQQLDQIFGTIREHFPDGQFGQMVIGGTFNNVPDSDLVRRMATNDLIDHFIGQPLQSAATFWRTSQIARLDYLWTTPNIEVIGSNVIDTNASDHRLVVIGIALR